MRSPGNARRHVSTCAVVFVVALLPFAVPAPAAAARRGRPSLCATLATKRAAAPRLAVLSAFPAELAPLVAATDVQETVTVDGRSYDLGVLAGVRVVLGLLGIGMVNATTRATSVLANFDVAGVVVSGVAGSPPQRIGDVIVPEEWIFTAGGPPYPVNPALLALARLAADAPTLGQCTSVPPDATAVCLPYQPAVLVGGRGQTDDPFRGTPVPCLPGGSDLFGCELPTPSPAAAAPGAAPAEAQAEDMETAAVASVATERGIPYVAFRAASDSGSFSDFGLYYHLAARNEAAATIAFLQRFAGLGGRHRSSRHVCALLARRRWRHAAAILALRPSASVATIR